MLKTDTVPPIPRASVVATDAEKALCIHRFRNVCRRQLSHMRVRSNKRLIQRIIGVWSAGQYEAGCGRRRMLATLFSAALTSFNSKERGAYSIPSCSNPIMGFDGVVSRDGKNAPPPPLPGEEKAQSCNIAVSRNRSLNGFPCCDRPLSAPLFAHSA